MEPSDSNNSYVDSYCERVAERRNMIEEEISFILNGDSDDLSAVLRRVRKVDNMRNDSDIGIDFSEVIRLVIS